MAKKAVSGHTTPKHKFPKNHCFACGPENPDGMRLKFYFHEETRSCWANIRLPRRFQGAPGHSHGGIVATILDEAMGKVNKLRNAVALTRKMEVEFLKPVPLGQPLIVEGRERRVVGRRHYNQAELRNPAGEVLARSTGLFIAVDAEKMFAKFIRREQRGAAAAGSRS
ncbi:MAG TPA: PaaI family thioesterase [Prosthecobacter sp.]|nr:PaaI family thioesterase [Prosthecobacter sp.]